MHAKRVGQVPDVPSRVFEHSSPAPFFVKSKAHLSWQSRSQCYTGTRMSSLSPRLQVRVQQKQILTPGLVQMVSLLQLNRLELKEMISAEVAQNPVLEESADGVEELTADE